MKSFNNVIAIIFMTKRVVLRVARCNFLRATGRASFVALPQCTAGGKACVLITSVRGHVLLNKSYQNIPDTASCQMLQRRSVQSKSKSFFLHYDVSKLWLFWLETAKNKIVQSSVCMCSWCSMCTTRTLHSETLIYWFICAQTALIFWVSIPSS